MDGLLPESVPLGGKETDVGKDKGVGMRHVPRKVAKTSGTTFVGIPILRGSGLNLCFSGFLLFRTPECPDCFQVRASLLLPCLVENLP